jgi:outer membrane protein TolC
MKTRIAIGIATALLSAWTAGAQQAPGEALTLKRAVALALTHSRDLKYARAQQDVAARAAGLRRSVFLPNLYTGSDVAYSKGFPLGAPQVFNLSYQQTVFDAPKRGEYRAAETRAEMQRLETDRMRDEIIVRTVTACLELRNVRSALAIERRESESAARILEVTRERQREGFELAIEVTRAELTAARIAQHIAQLASREEQLENDLRSLLGLIASDAVVLAEDDLPAAGEAPSAALAEIALANSIDLKQAELERRARQHRLSGEKGGYLPTLEIVGQYGVFSRQNNYDQFYQRFERHNVTFGLRAKIPIFSSTRAASVSLAQSELRAAEEDLARRRAALENEVRRRARETRELEASREVARLEHKLAQESLQVQQAQFEEGKITLRDLEKGRLEEQGKWRAFLDADLARQKARLELLRTTGQLAQVFQ